MPIDYSGHERGDGYRITEVVPCPLCWPLLRGNGACELCGRYGDIPTPVALPAPSAA